MRRSNLLALLSLLYSLLVLSACKNSQSIQYEIPAKDAAAILNIFGGETGNMSEEDSSKYHPINDYRATRTIKNDLQHTRLEVRFDWAKQHLIGQATIDIKPHFYDVEQVVLDAKGMQIHRVALVNPMGKGDQDLAYTYPDSMRLLIQLDRSYSRNESYRLFIDYTAQPNDLPKNVFDEVLGEKGLYFINPDGTETDKPQQIWTQGETESNSIWFPTIDHPTQNSSQEILITVEDRFKTLSNGKLVSSSKNGDGTRTDHWHQKLPHTPYLFMLAVGEYAIVTDEWNGISMSYYVEPEYEEHARAIFGTTPAMMQFFSELLDYPYPWDKYDQVIVRDYTSGAMENTGAVVFGEFAQQTTRELLDGNDEETISHEIIHQWFGNIVTCESWSHLSLNESFATYGEYLWYEHAYGKQRADEHLNEMLQDYLLSTIDPTEEHPIRFFYEHRDDLFDAISYSKGGCVLHMLRNYLGDEAFFEGVRHYLKENEFSSAEIHDLRIAFEDISGEDLNWFFNQWFMKGGHPELAVTYGYNTNTKEAIVEVEQLQDVANSSLFLLPLSLAIYTEDAVQIEQIVVDKRKQEFRFPVSEKVILMSLDPDRVLVGTISDNKTLEQYNIQLERSSNYSEQLDAMSQIAQQQLRSEKNISSNIAKKLKSESAGLRIAAIEQYAPNKWASDTDFIEQLKNIAFNDSEAPVREAAVEKLAELKSKALSPTFQTIYEQDQSYHVMNEALIGMAGIDEKKSLALASEAVDIPQLQYGVLDIYASYGDSSHDAYFQKVIKDPNSSHWKALETYGIFLARQDMSTLKNALPLFEDKALNSNKTWIKFRAMRSLNSLADEIALERTQSSDKTMIGQLEEKEMLIRKMMKSIAERNTDPKMAVSFNKMGGIGE